jgi:hypothetical protein
MRDLSELGETNVSSLLSEGLSAEVEAVLSDNSVLVVGDSTLSTALTVVSGVGEPNVFVSHLS